MLDYVRVKDLYAYLHHVGSSAIKKSDQMPNLIQQFSLPKESHNSVIKVIWTPLSVRMELATNKYSMFDSKCTLEARTATFECLDVYSRYEEIKNKGHVFEILSKSMWQIYNQIKRNSEVLLDSGNFYFSINEKD